MAYNPNDLRVAGTAHPQPLRASAEAIRPGTFAAGSGTLAPLTAVAFNSSTNKWGVWATGGSNDTATIRGFVWPDPVVLDSDEEVLGQIMVKGRLHIDDVPAVGGTADQIKTALRATALARGFIIDGLTQAH